MLKYLSLSTLLLASLAGCQTTTAEVEETIVVEVNPVVVQPRNACFDRGALVRHLEGNFSESPTAAGLAANGSVIEVFTAPDGITWTIVLTQPNGATCVMASGESWMGMPRPAEGNVS